MGNDERKRSERRDWVEAIVRWDRKKDRRKGIEGM